MNSIARKRSLEVGARIRIGTQDLKIASVAIVRQALLLTSNLRDFQQVPGLALADWLH